ncbi:unnamed protein product [Leuciscus chuanchicus]
MAEQAQKRSFFVKNQPQDLEDEEARPASAAAVDDEPPKVQLAPGIADCQKIITLAKSDVLRIQRDLDMDKECPRTDKTMYRYFCEALLVFKHVQCPQAVEALTDEEWINRKELGDRVVVGLREDRASSMHIALSKEEEAILDLYFVNLRPENLQPQKGTNIFFVSSDGNAVQSVSRDMNRLHELYKIAPFTSQCVRRAVETVARNLPAEQKGAILHYMGASAGVFKLQDVADAALLLESLASRSADATSLDTRGAAGGPRRDFLAFLDRFPVSLEGVPPSKKQRMEAGFSEDRNFYDKWRATQYAQREKHLLSYYKLRKPSAAKVSRLIAQEGWRVNCPRPEDIVQLWKPAPNTVLENDDFVIRCVSNQTWTGLAIKDFGAPEENKDERKLLLALESGRVNVRSCVCPVPGCGISTTRIDRHLKSHAELSTAAKESVLKQCKRKKVLAQIAALRATDPEVPLVSNLGLMPDIEDCEPSFELAEDEEEQCSNPGCKEKIQSLWTENKRLNEKVDTLSTALRDVTRRYRRLQKKSTSMAAGSSSKVKRRLFTSLGSRDDPLSITQASTLPPASSDLEPSTSQQPDVSQEPEFDQRLALKTIMEEFRVNQLGPDPSSKHKDNVNAKMYRIKKFLQYMAEGKSRLSTLCFLNETSRIHAWISSLRHAKMKETTIEYYVQNVSQFLVFISDTPPPSCRLSKTVLFGLRREMQSIKKSLKRKVAMHRTSVKTKKEQRVLSKLESDVATTSLQWEFYGHLSAYLAALYGHRGGVYQNMTISEVEEAQECPNENVFLINIQLHKTNQAFVPAQIAVTKEEYDWMLRFLKIRRRLPGGSSAKYFFFTSTTNVCKKLVTYFRHAWKSMGLPGNPNFTDLRTSIASHAKFTHSEGDRLKVSKFMCHDVQTADKFYVTNLSATQALEHRKLFEAALLGEDNTVAGVKRRRHGPEEETHRKRAKTTGSSEETSSDTTADTSPETSQGEEEVAGSAQGQKKTSPVVLLKKPVVVVTPIKSSSKKRVLRPRRISPIKVSHLNKMNKQKAAKARVKKAIRKCRVKK